MKLLRDNGYLNWVLPLMLAFAAVDVLLSGRDLSMMFAELAGIAQANRNPIMPWLQRAVSLVLVIISIERIANHFSQHRPVPSLPLAWAYVAYWACTVAAPSLLGAHPQVSHEYTYALVIGFAALLATTQEIGRIVDGVRTALFLLVLLSVVLVPIWPSMVLDESYTQGLLPGVPRLGGVAPHPVAMGMYAQMFLLLLWARPFQRRWLTVLAWIIGLGVLFFAQSKTAWIAFILCSAAMFSIRTAPQMWKRISDPREGAFGIFACLIVMAVAAGVLGLALFADVGGAIDGFLDTSQGAQLMTMTGRDQIWAVAWETWNSHKLFGYGPSLFDDEFRLAVGMPNATNAHNQFMDTLARSGAVGAFALVVYALVLLALSLKYARRTGGLSVALFTALALRSISEVPLMLFGYGIEFVGHLLLVVTLAAAASMNAVQTVPRARPVYGVPA
jgi:O-antigen ligase